MRMTTIVTQLLTLSVMAVLSLQAEAQVNIDDIQGDNSVAIGAEFSETVATPTESEAAETISSLTSIHADEVLSTIKAASERTLGVDIFSEKAGELFEVHSTPTRSQLKEQCQGSFIQDDIVALESLKVQLGEVYKMEPELLAYVHEIIEPYFSRVDRCMPIICGEVFKSASSDSLLSRRCGQEAGMLFVQMEKRESKSRKKKK